MYFFLLRREIELIITKSETEWSARASINADIPFHISSNHEVRIQQIFLKGKYAPIDQETIAPVPRNFSFYVYKCALFFIEIRELTAMFTSHV